LNAEDHRYLFTLIQKFRTEEGDTCPKLSDRSDIIVIAVEAHRSQYYQFTLNTRNALRNATFIGFTGAPMMSLCGWLRSGTNDRATTQRKTA
jgi:type I restriction enzyme R subunit